MDLSSPELEATRMRLVTRFGPVVEPWWERLPGTVRTLADRWDLVIADAIGRGNTSLVLRCRRTDGRSAVLKLVPDPMVATGEATALRRWARSGRVPLVWGSDDVLGALLLEALPSELPLTELGITVATDDLVDLVSALHRCGTPTGGGGVMSLAERVDFIFEFWVKRLVARGEVMTGVVPVERLRSAHELARGLVADPGPEVLLHGDLHPGNVLDGGPDRGLIAIDPRPCVGDPAFDAVDWVFWGVDDPHDWPLRGRELAEKLGLDPGRLWSWCIAFAPILAAAKAARGADRRQVDALLALAG